VILAIDVGEDAVMRPWSQPNALASVETRYCARMYGTHGTHLDVPKTVQGRVDDSEEGYDGD
jgi:hypothetical protein